MGEIITRQTTVEDALGIANVQVETWKTAYKGLMPEDYLLGLKASDKAPKWEESLRNPDGRTFLVPEDRGQIVGFCNVGPSRDEDANKETGELYAIYVLFDYTGGGVGSRLMEKGLEILKDQGFKKATLWVLDGNKKTRNWYESRGWKSDGKGKTDSKRGFDLYELRYQIGLV